MTDPTEKSKTLSEPTPATTGGSSSADPRSDDFAASITEAQPYDENATSPSSVERDEQGSMDSVLAE
ncbi:MAG TPA: hypothetical protein VF598_03345 [Hymenobacter sp.]|jgi:hypothetical protein